MKTLFCSVLLFVLVFVSHARSPVITSFDSMWSIYVAHSIVHEGNINLDEFRPQIKARDRFGVRKKFGHYYNFFPPGAAFFAVPFVYLFELAPTLWIEVLPGIEAQSNTDGVAPTVLDLHLSVERLIASFIIAGTALIMFWIGLEYLAVAPALILALLFSFCTSAWSTASRALWQHGPSMFLIATALLLFVRGKRNATLVGYAAIPLALSFVVRPTNSVSIAIFALYVAVYAKEQFVRFSCIGLLTISPFIWGSLEVYERVLPSYFQAQRVGIHPDIWNAMAANLLSPSRGIFIFSPFLLIGLLYALFQLSRSRAEGLTLAALAVVLLHCGAVSAFPSWWGGHCYGPRYMSEVVPYLIFLFIPILAEFSTRSWRSCMLPGVTLLILSGWSLFAHYQGAMRPAVYGWNVIPDNIDDNPGRVWDWSDPQFMR